MSDVPTPPPASPLIWFRCPTCGRRALPVTFTDTPWYMCGDCDTIMVRDMVVYEDTPG